MKTTSDDKVLSFNFNEEVDRFFDDRSLTNGAVPDAVILMGGVAAGKTSIRRQNYSHGYVLIDAAEIFISLSQGEYLPFPGPIEEPLNLVGHFVVKRAFEERRNIVTEVIGGVLEKLEELVTALNGAGYKVHVAMVNCSMDAAMERNANRSKDNISAYYAESFHHAWILEACKNSL